MTRLAILAAGLAGLLVQELSGPVIRVIDGDTIEVEIAGERERVRYIGIDTPEMNDRRPEVRELARAARRANARLVERRRVRLELDVEERDRYGRLLAYVWVGDTMVNEALVRSGHAAPYTFPPNVRYVDRFVAAAREARAEAEGAPSGAGRGEPDARAPPEAIPAIEAAAHVGEVTTVCDEVASTRTLTTGRRPTFLNLGRPYPNQDLTILIWGEDRSKFAEPPERAFRDRYVCVTGRIELYRGTPQIVVREPASLRIPE